jgi:hypothetical protein
MPTCGADRPKVKVCAKLFLKQIFKYVILSIIYCDNGKVIGVDIL